MISFIAKLLAALVILAFVGAFIRTWQLENSDMQKAFSNSAAPNPPLDGFYLGSVDLPLKTTWVGKKFNAASSTGVNMFENSVERYPFSAIVRAEGSATYLNVSYDLPQNPFWLKPVVDEIVETGPGHYLGKLTVRVIPGYPFTLGFFKLSR